MAENHERAYSDIEKMNIVLRIHLLLAIMCVFAPDVRAADADTFDCLMEPMMVTEIGSASQGVIKRLLVDRSDFVTSGQPILELESEAEAISLESAKVRSNMQSEISAREAELVLSKQNLDRVRDLHKQNLIPTQTLDEAQAQKVVAGAALVQSLENMKLALIETRRAEQLLGEKTIRSPIDGVVVAQKAFPGEFVYDNPLMTIAQLDPLRIEVVMPARFFGIFNPGDTAMIQPEIDHPKPLMATVQLVDQLLDTHSGTFGMRLTLPNPDFSIPGGQKCQLTLQSGVALVSSEQ